MHHSSCVVTFLELQNVMSLTYLTHNHHHSPFPPVSLLINNFFNHEWLPCCTEIQLSLILLDYSLYIFFSWFPEHTSAADGIQNEDENLLACGKAIQAWQAVSLSPSLKALASGKRLEDDSQWQLMMNFINGSIMIYLIKHYLLLSFDNRYINLGQ